MLPRSSGTRRAASDILSFAYAGSFIGPFQADPHAKCPGFLRISGSLVIAKRRSLDSGNVLRLPAFGALGHVELHGLAFLQALEAPPA